ncbi:PH domain-containing protein [Enterococcus sp. LJL99]
MNFLFYGILITTNLVIALSSRIPANPHKNIILETTLPADKLKNPLVLGLSKKYKQRLLLVAFIFSILAIPIIWIPYDSITMLYFFVMLFGLIATTQYVETIYIRKMTELKIKNNWSLPTQPLLIDTKLILTKNRKMISSFWFLPTIILTLLSLFFSWKSSGMAGSFWLIAILSILFLALFIYLYYIVSRFPVKPLTNDEKINQKINDITRHYWSLLAVVSSLIISPLGLLMSISLSTSYQALIVSSAIYLLALFLFIAFTLYSLFSMRRKQDQLIAQTNDYRYSDDDQYWRYAIYINPNDERTFIPDRLGMNVSVNLGKLSGKIMVGVTAVIIFFALGIATIPLALNDFTANPFKLAITNSEVQLSAPLTKTQKIPLSSIESVTLLDHLPKEVIRIFGTATTDYWTGDFSVDGKDAYMLVYKKSSPILEIKTSEKNYYYTDKKSEQTKRAAELLLNE